MKIEPDKALTLIIDEQLQLLPSITESEALLHNTGILIQGLKLLNVPMIITHFF